MRWDHFADPTFGDPTDLGLSPDMITGFEAAPA